MSRALSSTFVEAINSTETDEVFLILVTISHPDLVDPIRVTSDSVKTTLSDGTEYIPFPFRASLPDDSEEASGALAKLTIDAVDRRVVEAVRKISGIPDVELSIVLASDPDTTEAAWPTFKMSNARYDKMTIEGDLVLELLDQEPFPADSFDPARFPGMF